MAKAFNEHSINEVRFEILLPNDGCTLKTLVMDTNEFPGNFFERLLKLKTCRFILKEQSSFSKIPKKNLLSSDFLICFDLVENYAFIIQN